MRVSRDTQENAQPRPGQTRAGGGGGARVGQALPFLARRGGGAQWARIGRSVEQSPLWFQSDSEMPTIPQPLGAAQEASLWRSLCCHRKLEIQLLAVWMLSLAL